MVESPNRRVCIIRRAYYPAESHVRRNAESLVAAGYAVDLICIRNEGEVAFEVVNGVKIHRLPLRAHRAGLMGYVLEYSVFFCMAFFYVSWFQIKQPFAIIETDSMPDFLVFVGLIPRLMGAYVILYLFESMPEIWAQRRSIPMTHWFIRLLKWQERLSCSFADAVICCHDMARNALVDSAVPADKITTILNVPDENVFHRDQSNRLRENGLFRLIQHGTMTENYGIQYVIRALALLDRNLHVHYDVVGAGEYRSFLEDMVSQLGLQDRVTFHGFVSRERLLELLGLADAGIVPMLYEYQSPNKMFELIALGKPVIASNLKTFQQHFEEDEILYFKAGDTEDLAHVILQAMDNPGMMSEMAERASRHYEQYRWGKMREKYFKIYRDLCKE